ncbi:MAG TPA: type VI secretion system lipoprotein TssJ [Myxococcales bacterium]|nr:type VI secretion system lipoprotein TssJ [Myxococcales bacterium]
MGRVQTRGSRGLWAAAAAVAALGAASSGCATCKTPPPFFVTLEAEQGANLGAATRVMVIQLRNLDAIKAADFNELRKDPAAALAETMAGAPTEMWVNAGQVETKWIKRDPDARFVAAVAVFQQPSQRWWSSYKLKAVPPLQCREVPVESFAGRRPYASEEQMRFYVGPRAITTDEAGPPPGQPPPAESARDVPARKGRKA